MRAVLHFDGGGQAPGPISVAVVLEREGREPVEWSCRFDEGTNNVAEYQALRHGLALARALGVTDIEAFGDSKLVVEQVNGRWKCKQQGLRPLLAACQFHLDHFASWELSHVRREDNAHADRIARAALEGKS
jgi:ribonuclease HI